MRKNCYFYSHLTIFSMLFCSLYFYVSVGYFFPTIWILLEVQSSQWFFSALFTWKSKWKWNEWNVFISPFLKNILSRYRMVNGPFCVCVFSSVQIHYCISSLLHIFWWNVHCFSYVCFYILCVTHMLFLVPFPLYWGFCCCCLVANLCPALLQPHGLCPTEPYRPLCPWDFPGKSTGVGCHFFLQEIFVTQGSNWHLLCLLHWQADSFIIKHHGSPYWGLVKLSNNCQIKITYTIHTKKL